MEILFNYAWFLFVIFGLLNYFIVRSRVRNVVKQKPELATEASGILRGYLFFVTIPFLLLGAIQLAGGYHTPFFIWYEKLTNPFVIASIVIVFGSWLVYGYWLFFRDGGNKLIQYRLVLRSLSNSDLELKIVWVLILLAGFFVFVTGMVVSP